MPRSRVKRLAIVLGAVLVAGFTLIGILSITRGTPVSHVSALGTKNVPPAIGDSLFERMMELYIATSLEPGNRVEVMTNGNETYPRLWQDIATAKQTLTVQMYYSQPGDVADHLADLLVDRARHGVRVLLLLDAFGSQNLKKSWAERLTHAGVEVAILRKLKWYTLHNAQDRSHVRVVVVDGRIAYTGGFGLADYWLGDGKHKDQWRDSNVRFEGPAVMQLQSAFAAAWAEATGELIAGDLFFPRDAFRAQSGPVTAGLLYTAPTSGSTPAERFLALTIASARKTLYIENSYFVPDDDFRRLLGEAAHRGVDVRVITANQHSDVKITYYAGRFRYPQLLRDRVRIYEYQPSMLHSKTIVADGLWSTVGSMNFDNRSLAFNNESNLVMLDSAMGAKMDSIFMADMALSKEITMDVYNHRPWWHHVLEWVTTAISRLL